MDINTLMDVVRRGNLTPTQVYLLITRLSLGIGRLSC